MKNQFRDRLSFCATMIEMVVGALILIGCIISGIGLIGTTSIADLLGDAHYLQNRMSDACLILIGAEMLKMITSYTIDSVVDVMLLAIARQMIVEHTSPQENLLAVLSVGVLFVIRKFLYISRLDKRRELEKKKKEDKQKDEAQPAAVQESVEEAEARLKNDEMRKRDEFRIDEELEELERLKPPSSARRRKNSAASSRWRKTLSDDLSQNLRFADKCVPTPRGVRHSKQIFI